MLLLGNDYLDVCVFLMNQIVYGYERRHTKTWMSITELRTGKFDFNFNCTRSNIFFNSFYEENSRNDDSSGTNYVVRILILNSFFVFFFQQKTGFSIRQESPPAGNRDITCPSIPCPGRGYLGYPLERTRNQWKYYGMEWRWGSPPLRCEQIEIIIISHPSDAGG